MHIVDNDDDGDCNIDSGDKIMMKRRADLTGNCKFGNIQFNAFQNDNDEILPATRGY